MTGSGDPSIDAAGVDRAAPGWIEVSRDAGPPATIGLAWSTGRVVATAGPGWVALRRRRGVVGVAGKLGGLRLTLAELRALDVACGDWVRHRDAWAAFYTTHAGHPPGLGVSHYYQAPGATPPRRLGARVLGRRTGDELRGHDDLVPLAPSRHLTAGVHVVAELWRRGEAHGPPAGSWIGLRYRLTADLHVDARRPDLHVCRADAAGGSLVLEAAEATLPSALLVVCGDSAPRE